MKKILFLLLFIFTFTLPVSAENSAENSAEGEPFKAVVKIGSYWLDSEGFLKNYSNGSGVIIDPKGIVLTNYHVITAKDSFDNKEYELGYEICLPMNTTDEPNCSYTGKVIAKNEELDLALLKMEAIPGLAGTSTLPSLELNQTDSININNEVTAIGYPSIGGNTVTITKGILSGKVFKYNINWLKTDAVVSFGNSGGAAIDKENKIIGITSRSHSDLAGSLGYIISVNSINSWLLENKAKVAKFNAINSKLEYFIKKYRNINSKNNFQNDYPPYVVDKPADWSFTFRGGNKKMTIDKREDSNGGFVDITVDKKPYYFNLDNVIPEVRRNLNNDAMLALASISQSQDITLNKLKAKKIIISTALGDDYSIFLPSKEYLLKIEYDYGKDDKDKQIIDKIINSISIKENKPSKFIESKNFKNDYFSINLKNDWVIRTNYNSKEKPIEIYNKKFKSSFIDVEIKKYAKAKNNDDLLKDSKQALSLANQLIGMADYKVELVGKPNAHYKINNGIKDAIKMELISKKVSDGKELIYIKTYQFKKDDKWITISLSTIDNKKIYKQIVPEFDKLVNSIALINKIIDTDKDGLSDDDEKKYKTDPKKPDSDGDGFLDGIEVKNGFNPLGKGRIIK